MRITKVNTFVLHVPLTRARIHDSMHQVTHWGAPGILIETDSDLQGCGYTGTHAHLPTDRLITSCIAETYAPLLVGEEIPQRDELWRKLYHFPPAQWVGRSGITHLALSAVDIALWDLRAKAAGLPLWKLMGGDRNKRIEAYNTAGGWLNWSLEELKDYNRCIVETDGFRGVKIKVGSPDPCRDIERVEAVRKVVGPTTKLMVDANGRWDLETAVSFGSKLKDYDVYWFEEPLWYDDIPGHAVLTQRISTPIALGEQLYSLAEFRNFINAQALHFVQPDAVRLAGITEWWQVANLALANHLPVVPHIGDMMQVHLHLALAHRSTTVLEYIPWLRECFAEPATVKDGCFTVPESAGAGTTLSPKALKKYAV